MKKDDYVHFKAPGFRTGKYRVSDVRDDMVPPVCAIRYGSFGNTWVRQSECELCSERNARLEAKAGQKYADIITAWASGARTFQDIAEKLGVPKTGLWSRVNAAKRKGLIHD